MFIRERIKDSFIISKIIFGATVFLFALAITGSYVIFASEPSMIMQESANIQDKITAVVNPDG